MKYYVVIDKSGERGGVFEEKSKAIAAARSNNAQKYDSPQGGEGGFEVKTVEGGEDATNEMLYKMAKRGNKMESKRIDRYLGLNETEAYTYEQVKGVPQSFLDEAHNMYFGGDVIEFRKHFKTVSEVAQYMSFVIENGMDVREVQKMLSILA
jgi:hypothetical protein